VKTEKGYSQSVKCNSYEGSSGTAMLPPLFSLYPSPVSSTTIADAVGNRQDRTNERNLRKAKMESVNEYTAKKAAIRRDADVIAEVEAISLAEYKTAEAAKAGGGSKVKGTLVVERSSEQDVPGRSPDAQSNLGVAPWEQGEDTEIDFLSCYK
jgi:hypothetical protein